MEALENVIDPELGLDFVSLGLVYDVEIEDPDVPHHLHAHHPACPIGPQVTEQMKEFVGEVEGVEKVFPKMVFSPMWSPERCPRTRSSRSVLSGSSKRNVGASQSREIGGLQTACKRAAAGAA